jgi:4-hydroxybenzoate polyprenyltransferase/phosphoserine phosphatase
MDILAAERQGADLRPLVVDLDGTLIKSDLLVESFSTLLSTKPLRGPGTLGALREGRAAFKARVAAQVEMDLASLPLNPALLDYLQAERARGRRIYLASAAHETYVRAMADHIGLFDGVFASDGQTNLRGAAKSRVLCAAFGRGGFDYAGNSTADLDVWKDAGAVVVVNATPGLIRTVTSRHPGALVLDPRATSLSDYRQAMRVHQWLKNLLIFVPAFTAHLYDLHTMLVCVAAFLSFSLSASGVYVLNDLLDLRSDRAHPTKRFRPFAAGALDVVQGLRLGAACMLVSLGIALFLPWRFLLVLAVYYALTGGYSMYLKRKANIDVLMLACLYGVRLVAGAAAVSVALSPWLLMFSLFFFLCLALVKRMTELIDRQQKGTGDPPGRSYRLSDLPILQTMASTSGYVSVLVFVLYVNSPAVAALYANPERLWAIPVILLYWISRILIMTQRGQMHDDPVVFAMDDRVSMMCAALMAGVVLVSL